jgi:hypothetical protein
LHVKPEGQASPIGPKWREFALPGIAVNGRFL